MPVGLQSSPPLAIFRRRGENSPTPAKGHSVGQAVWTPRRGLRELSGSGLSRTTGEDSGAAAVLSLHPHPGAVAEALSARARSIVYQQGSEATSTSISSLARGREKKKPCPNSHSSARSSESSSGDSIPSVITTTPSACAS